MRVRVRSRVRRWVCARAYVRAYLEPHTILDAAPRTDAHVRPDHAALPDGGGLVHEHVALEGVARRQLRGPLLPQAVQVEVQARQIVFGLADVHPIAGEDHSEELAVAGDVREDLLLDGRRAHLDAVEDGRREHVHPRIDFVAHKPKQEKGEERRGKEREGTEKGMA